MTVLNMTGDEGGPGDDRTNVDRRMEKDKVGRDGTVELGIHVYKVIGEESIKA